MNSLRRLLAAWRSDLEAAKPANSFSWRPSTIPGYRFQETRPDEASREWTIHELTTSAELYTEGKALHHCVFTYAHACRCRMSTIWSLRLHMNGQEKRIATLEIDPAAPRTAR